MAMRVAWRGLLASSVMLTPLAQGAEWTTSAGVTPGLMFTDNVCLSPDNEQGEWVGLVTPDISLTGQGRRASLNLAAALEMNTLSDSKLEELGCSPQGLGLGNREQVSPRLRAVGRVEAIDNWLFVDASAHADQNLVNPFAAGGDDGLNRTGNVNTSYRYAIRPYIQHRFASEYELRASYSYDEQYNSVDTLGDSERNMADFYFGRVPETARLTWAVIADYEEIDYQRSFDRPSQTNELTSARFALAWQFNRQWQINGFAGAENNTFLSNVEQEIDGEMWDIGVRWTPNSRVEVNAGTGERFFGDTPRFSVNYSHKRSTLRADYRRDLTFDRSIRSGENILPGQDEFGDPIAPSDGTPLGIDGEPVLPSNSPILDERFSLSYAYRGRLSTFQITGSQSEQFRAIDGRRSTFTNAALSLSRNLSRQTSVTGGLSWGDRESEQQLGDLLNDSQTYTAFAALQRQLATNLDMVGRYQYRVRESDTPNNEYTENRVTLTFRYQF